MLPMFQFVVCRQTQTQTQTQHHKQREHGNDAMQFFVFYFSNGPVHLFSWSNAYVFNLDLIDGIEFW